MTTYISILRGINVSGHKIIKMDALKKMYEQLGFQHVRTYVQSGNVIFQHNESRLSDLEQTISKQIQINFGFDVPVIILTINMLKKVIEGNPFVKDPMKEPSFLHITFLSAKPAGINMEKIESKKLIEEEISFSDNAVYLYCPSGYGNTRLTNNFLESALKVGATTRNWRSTNELLKKAQET